MSKVMNQCYLGSDLEFMQELLGEDPAYDKFLNKLESESDRDKQDRQPGAVESSREDRS